MSETTDETTDETRNGMTDGATGGAPTGAELRALADRIEIEALRGEFTDAGMTRDYDRLAELFTDDGTWRIPDAGLEFTGSKNIRAAIERLQGNWEFFVQTIHPGAVRIDGDTAEGRSYVAELGRLRDGGSHVNYALYHDHYRRTAQGWRFTERRYEVRYVDTTPLPGGVPGPRP
ncbi:nuclear transport factor 2 family protein [Streptomyces laurentii]|uniref:nuclear transport factor 2 family protein n=1 Tax=Streptomyces laurentii TaxID=39478 RepID=UPI003684A3B2